MPHYEYYCPPCQAKFELLRPMTLSDEPVVCPKGHSGSERILSLFAVFNRDKSDLYSGRTGGGCGGCAGGQCACASH